ncbi:hypothetical protein PHET_10426 [Paragonimus heterotremus]|uniref:Uncharacterized protein n=1 Tax=Paragonimus heterotremus TaxID=100268 RepID=A0A8J4SQU8_9TREM|nr:hypothetical protein PHET_10426 [Paragonimus heterotremus]
MIIRPSSTTVCTSATCDLPTLCRPSSLHSSLPVKTVPFLPRVILSVQPSFPLSTVGSQTPFFQTTSAISTEAHQPMLSQQLATLHLPPLASTNSAVVSNPTITVSNVQFCPLVLTTTSKSQSSISINAPAPIHLQITSSPITSVGSSEVVAFSDKISTASSSPIRAVNMECDGNLSPTITPSTSLITSLVNRGRNQSTVTVASVVITPQCSGNMQSAFALRNSVHCTTATTNSVNPNSCSFLMDASILGNQSSSAMHASHIPTPSLRTNATVEQSIFGAPFLPSQSPSGSRVLIQRPSNPAQVTQSANSAGVEPSSLTSVCASSKNADLSPSASTHIMSKTGSFVSDAFNTFHNLNSPKCKLHRRCRRTLVRYILLD